MIKDLSKRVDKINNVLNSLDETLLQTQKLVDDLNQSPSDILKQTYKYGPGEIDENSIKTFIYICMITFLIACSF